jgi:serine/threonine protein kinase
MATVSLGRKVEGEGYGSLAAIKVIHASLAKQPQFVAMFADEAKILPRLLHPNVSRTLEVGFADHVGYIAMELLLGRTLADAWDAAEEAKVPFRLDLAAWICAEVARGLHYAHELADDDGRPLDLIHRDVNPSNIFLGYDGTIKLFDFGLAMAHGRKVQTKGGIVKGKVAYLSPEQVDQVTLDRRSDIFSLGATLWETTTLARLFKRDRDLDTILAIRDGLVPDARKLVEGYPEALYAIVSRALATKRDDRYASALLLAEDLDAFVGSQSRDSMGAQVGELLDRLFPGEREKQAGWLARAASSPANLGTIAPPAPIVREPSMRPEPSEVIPLVKRKRKR